MGGSRLTDFVRFLSPQRRNLVAALTCTGLYFSSSFPPSGTFVSTRDFFSLAFLTQPTLSASKMKAVFSVNYENLFSKLSSILVYG